MPRYEFITLRNTMDQLSRLTGHLFSEKVKERGYQYYINSRALLVNLTSSSSGLVAKYLVFGTRAYDVTIHKNNNLSIEAECTCQYFDDYTPCKHIWAAVLDAEKKNIFATPKEVGWKDLLNRVPTVKQEKPFYLTKVEKPRYGFYIINLNGSQSKKKWQISLLTQETQVNGKLGKIKNAETSQDKIHLYQDPLDKRALLHFLGCRTLSRNYYYSNNETNTILLNGISESDILKELSVNKKLFVDDFNSKRHELNFVDQELILKLDLTENESNFTLTPRFELTQPSHLNSDNKLLITNLDSPMDTMPTVTDINERVLNVENEIVKINLSFNSEYLFIEPFVYYNKTMMIAHLEPYSGWLDIFKKRESIEIPKDEINSFLNTFFSIENKPIINLPDSIVTARIQDFLKIRFSITPQQNTKNYAGEFQFLYGNEYFTSSQTQSQIYNAETGQFFERNISQENLTIQEVVGKIPTLSNGFSGAYQFETSHLSEIVSNLFSQGLEVMFLNKKINNSVNYSTTITSGVNWFDLNVKLEFDQNNFLSLPQLLQGLKNGNNFVTLADGSVGFINSNWIQKFKNFSQAGTIHNEDIRLSKIQALFLSHSLTEDKNFQSDSRFQTFQKILTRLSNLNEIKPSPHFKGTLRSYQKQGLAWLKELSDLEIGSILADDMGLGKTIQILALLAEKPNSKTLIVAPKSLVFNWINEAKKFTPHMKFYNHTGSQRNHSEADVHIKNSDAIVTTYQTFRMDIEKFKDMTFDYLILDEAHYIKNSESQAYMACHLAQSKIKIALTGTPVENSISDLFSILSIVTPGLISERLANRFLNVKNPEELLQLSKALSPFILRRTKENVLKDLPDKSEQVLYCDLSPSETKKYNDLKSYYWAQLSGKIKDKGFSKSKIEILEALLRLRQAACHQGLLDKKLSHSTSTKFSTLLEQLKIVIDDGHKALIFSQFTSLLKLFETHLKNEKITYEYLDGKTSDRQEKVNNFQNNSEVQVFLISLKAGGVGLNLTSAEYVFILDPWWNPAAESQAIDRAHRIGQTKKVFAYKIIARNTIEEKILQLQESKKALAKSIFSANEKSFLKNLNFSDLQDLFT